MGIYVNLKVFCLFQFFEMRCHQLWFLAWWKLMSCLLEEGTFHNRVLPNNWSVQLASSCCSKENSELGVNASSEMWWRAASVSSATPNASSTELCCFGSFHFKTALMKDQLVLLWTRGGGEVGKKTPANAWCCYQNPLLDCVARQKYYWKVVTGAHDLTRQILHFWFQIYIMGVTHEEFGHQ